MTKDDFIAHLKSASSSGTLLTPKHDPNNLSTIYTRYRSVISHDAVAKWDTFIDSKQFTAIEYENTLYPSSPIYIEIVPIGSTFSPAGSGIPANSPLASTTVDRIIAVSGHDQGWHVFAADSQTIQAMEAKGDLKNKRTLT